MTRNEYVELAARSFTDLCELVEHTQRGLPLPPSSSLVDDAVGEVRGLWDCLVWVDRRLTAQECAVMGAVVQRIEDLGLISLGALPARLDDPATDRPLPDFLRSGLELDATDGRRRAGRMIGHLESFGYGLLAADREISEPELRTLRTYIGGLRDQADAWRKTHAANRTATLGASGAS